MAWVQRVKESSASVGPNCRMPSHTASMMNDTAKSSSKDHTDLRKNQSVNSADNPMPCQVLAQLPLDLQGPIPSMMSMRADTRSAFNGLAVISLLVMMHSGVFSCQRGETTQSEDTPSMATATISFHVIGMMKAKSGAT